MTDTTIAIFFILAGSFGLTIFACAVRWYFSRSDMSSLADVILALMAYQLSILASTDGLNALIANPSDRAMYQEAGWLFLGLSAFAYGFAVHPGEVLWSGRLRSLQAGRYADYRHSVIVGFSVGWLLPIAWTSYHLALFLG